MEYHAKTRNDTPAVAIVTISFDKSAPSGKEKDFYPAVKSLVTLITNLVLVLSFFLQVLLMSFALLVAPRYSPFSGDSGSMGPLSTKGTCLNRCSS